MTVDLYLVGAVVGGALLLAVLALVLVARSAKNIVVPRSASKDLVRRPFSEADVVAMPGLDAIIIGSGIGGLTTAALLARIGWRCLVLEQHDVAGGCTHEWTEKGFTFDTGLHYIGGGVHKKTSLMRKLFDMVTGSSVDWAPMADAYDVADFGPVGSADREQFAFVSGVARLKAKLLERFPNEKSAIDRYFELVREMNNAGARWVVLKMLPTWLAKRLEPWLLPASSFFREYGSRSTLEVFRGMTDNDGLIATLAYLFGDYGLPPTTSSFYIHTLVAAHYFGGAAYPVGGSENIARGAVQVIEAAGGRVLVRARVSEILASADGARAEGVRLTSGFEIRCPVVISDAGVYNTFATLLPKGSPLASLPGVRSIVKDLGAVEVEPGGRASWGVTRPRDRTSTTTTTKGAAAAAAAAAGSDSGGAAETKAREEDGDGDASPSLRSFVSPSTVLRPEMPRLLAHIPIKTAEESMTETMGDLTCLAPSTGHLYLFLGLKGSPEELKLPAANTWAMPGITLRALEEESEEVRKRKVFKGMAVRPHAYDRVVTEFHGSATCPSSIPFFYISFPCAKDPEWNARCPGKSTAIVITEAPFGPFAPWRNARHRHRGADYDALKTQLANLLREGLFERFPQLRGKVEFEELGTPLSNEYYLNAFQGSSYGAIHSPARFFKSYMKPETPVPGLYLTGQDALTNGVGGAMIGGLLAASKLSPRCMLAHAGVLLNKAF